MKRNRNKDSDWGIENEESGFDIKLLMHKAISLWPWLLVSVFLMSLVSLTYFYFATPSYKIHAKILIKDDDNNKGATGAMGDLSMLQSMGILSGASSVDNELEIVTSYTLMNEVVHDLQLNVTTFHKEGFKNVELYNASNPIDIKFITLNDSTMLEEAFEYDLKPGKSQTFTLINKDNDRELPRSSKWGDTLTLKSGVVVFSLNPNYKGALGNSYSIKVRNTDLVTRDYMKTLEAAIPNKQVSTINLTLAHTIPEKGEKVINTLIKDYMQANVDDNNRIADSTMRFIDSRLVVVSEQLTDIEKQIQNFKQDNDVADLTAQAQALIANTGDYAKEVAAQEVQLDVIQSLEDYLVKNKNNMRVVPASLLVQDPNLTAVTTQYNQLLMQRSRLLLATTEQNPMVQNLDEQLQNMRSDMLKGIASVKLSAKAALKSLKANTSQLEGQIRKVPAKERIAIDYTRQQQIRQELFLFLLQKREETAISRSSTIANARIIDAAKSEDVPYAPKKKVLFGIAVLLGLALPFGILYLKDLLNTEIKSKEDITNMTSLSILGEIGHHDENDFVVVTKQSRTLVSEQFRALRANLQFLLPNADEKVIMLTSSMSGEGKSFIATNLAMVFALAGKKVALLELDLRKPKIMTSIDMKFEKGFSQYIIGAASMQEIILPTPFNENLFVIPAGPIPPNPSELILHERTDALFNYLRAEFDYIVIDTTPNLVSDAQLLSKHAIVTLYVARLDYTKKEQLRLPDELKKNGKLPRLNLVINDIKPKKYGGGYYGYGYGYGYGNEYGYGGYVEEKGKGNKKNKNKK